MRRRVLILALMALAGTSEVPRDNRDGATRTGKERLGVKASDPQRVNDCNVPEKLRDPNRTRPTECPTSPAPAQPPARTN